MLFYSMRAAQRQREQRQRESSERARFTNQRRRDARSNNYDESRARHPRQSLRILREHQVQGQVAGPIERVFDDLEPNGIVVEPLSHQELMALDASDSRTKRGGKLEKEKNSAKSQAKVWTICFFLSMIFFVSLRVSDSTPNPDCRLEKSCDCLDLFDGVFTMYLLVLFFFTGSRVKLGCQSQKVYTTRRELKLNGRKIDLIYSVSFQIITALLCFAYMKDNFRQECTKNKRFQRMNSVAQVIMFLSIVQDICLLIRAVFVCQRTCRANKRKKMDPPQLSSDEEDDQEFIQSIEERNNRARGRAAAENRQAGANNNLVEGPDQRNVLLNSIRNIISTTSRRRNILGQLSDIERRLLEATQKSRQLSLKRYIESLPCMTHSEYQQKDLDMPDCPICLLTFTEDDELVVFKCDPKHYFHKKCGQEWLEVKTECPLCRADFTEQIHEFISHQEDINSDLARQAVNESQEEISQNNNDVLNVNINAQSNEQTELNELVRELTASMGELHQRLNRDQLNRRQFADLENNPILIIGPQSMRQHHHHVHHHLSLPTGSRHQNFQSLNQILRANQISPQSSPPQIQQRLSRHSNAVLINQNNHDNEIELGDFGHGLDQNLAVAQQRAIYEDIQRRNTLLVNARNNSAAAASSAAEENQQERSSAQAVSVVQQVNVDLENPAAVVEEERKQE